MSQQHNNRDRSYISRDEFEVFERNVDRSFAQLGEALGELSKKLDRQTTTNWPVLSGFAVLILTFVGMAGKPYVDDLKKVELKQESALVMIEGKFENARIHSDTNRHELDDILQREMRLQDEALQREMRMILNEPTARLRAIESELLRRREELNDLRNRTESNALTIAERMKIIEKVEAEIRGK